MREAKGKGGVVAVAPPSPLHPTEAVAAAMTAMACAASISAYSPPTFSCTHGATIATTTTPARICWIRWATMHGSMLPGRNPTVAGACRGGARGGAAIQPAAPPGCGRSVEGEEEEEPPLRII